MGVNKKFIFICVLATLIFSVGVIANEPIIDLRLEVYKNDSAIENWFHLTDGIPITYYRTGGTYNLTILDNKEGIVFNQPIEMNLEYDEIISETLDYDTPYNKNMYEFRVYHWDKLIFSKILNFCNKDGVCDTSETYESCPADCPLDHNDLICIADAEGLCDPDCGEDVDPDCNGKFYPYAGQDREVEAGNSLKFEGEIKNASKGKYSYSWFFEDDGSTKTGRKVSHKFDEEGVFAVDLTVTNQDGVHKDDTLIITATKKRIVKETKPFFTKTSLLIISVIVLLGIGLLAGFFFKKLKEIGRRLKISIITLILVLLVILGLLFLTGKGTEYRPVEYYHENYCEKDSDCGFGCESILKNPTVTSQAITGDMSIEMGPPCICLTNRCEVLTEEKKLVQETCKDTQGEEKYLCYNQSGDYLVNSGLCEAAGQYADECYFQVAKNGYSIKTCEKAGRYKEICKEDIKNTLEEICELIKPLDLKESCNKKSQEIILEEKEENFRGRYLSYVVFEEECKRQGSYFKSSCYRRLAQNLEDPTFCNKIENEYDREKCIVESATSKEFCEGLKIKFPYEDLQEECFAKFPDSTSDCEKLTDRGAKEKCYYNLGIRLNDISLCNKASIWKASCIFNAATSIGDCNKLDEEDPLKGDCIEKVNDLLGGYTPESATSIEDCNKIEQKKSQEECLAKFVTSVEECENMEYAKQSCYYNLALKLKDMGLCAKIDNMQEAKLYSGCIHELIASLTSVEECEEMTPLETYCYIDFAKKLNDISLCDRLEREGNRATCKRDVEEG